MMKTVTEGIFNLVSIWQQQEAAFVVEEMQAHPEYAPLLAAQIRSGAITLALQGGEIVRANDKVAHHHIADKTGKRQISEA